MNENEEMIEDITDVEEVTPVNNEQVNSSEVTTEQVADDSVGGVNTIESSVALESGTSTENVESVENLNENVPIVQVETKNKKKIPLIILLVVLLILDIAALVIYIIGIDKVLSFIK